MPPLPSLQWEAGALLGCLQAPGTGKVWKEGNHSEIPGTWGGLPQPDVMGPFAGERERSLSPRLRPQPKEMTVLKEQQGWTGLGQGWGPDSG